MKKIKITKKDWIYIAIIAALAIALWFFANLSGDRGSLADELKFQMGLKQTEIDGYDDIMKNNNRKLSLAEAKLKAQAVAAAKRESEYLTSIAALKKLIIVDRETKPVELTGNELGICNVRLDECMKQHTVAQLLLLSKDGMIKTWSEKFNLMSDNYKLRGNIIGLNGEIINTWEIAYKKKARRNLKSKIINGIIFTAAGFLFASFVK